MVTDKNLRNQILLLQGLLFRRHYETLFTFIYGIIPHKPKEYQQIQILMDLIYLSQNKTIWSICHKRQKQKQKTKHKQAQTHTQK